MNFQSICRVCISKNAGMISIFESHTFSECYLEISEVMTNCASIQIHKSDGFSEYICKKCLINLCLAYRFKQMCEESDYKFRNNLIVNNKGITSSIIPEEDIKMEYNNVNSVINEKYIEFNKSPDNVLSQIKCEFDEEETPLGVLETQPSGENIDQSSTDISKLHNGKYLETFQEGAPIIRDAQNKERDKINNSEIKYEISEINEEFNISLEPQLSNIKCEFDEEKTEELVLKNQLPKSLRIQPGKKPCKSKTLDKCNKEKRGFEHPKEDFYKCETCSKCFSRKGCLNKHMRIHTGEKPHKCLTCGQCFNRMHHLNNHMKIHTGEKPFKCETCGKCFNEKSNLTKHMRIHTGEKPYKCEICYQCFNFKRDLNRHVRIHTGEKPYKCETCHQCCSDKGNLIKHMRIHTGEKPYKCETCSQCFTLKGGLNRHNMRIHTDTKAYK